MVIVVVHNWMDLDLGAQTMGAELMMINVSLLLASLFSFGDQNECDRACHSCNCGRPDEPEAA
jgi:hypothetical protein